jgi:hypothetical protein
VERVDQEKKQLVLEEVVKMVRSCEGQILSTGREEKVVTMKLFPKGWRIRVRFSSTHWFSLLILCLVMAIEGRCLEDDPSEM